MLELALALCLAGIACATVLASLVARRASTREAAHLPKNTIPLAGTLSPRPSADQALMGLPCVPSRIDWPLVPAAPPPPTPLQHLFSGLCAAFSAERAAGFEINNCQDPTSFARLNAAVTSLLGGYAGGGNSDWRQYAAFNDLHYVRHLVDDSEDFELMVICWKKGQGSRVHNHAGSHCWLACLQGVATELQYRPQYAPLANSAAGSPRLPGVIASTMPCPRLEHTLRRELPTGGVGYINDHIALHAVRCPETCPSDEGTVTLHLYSPPIRRVRLYEPENNRVVERKPGFNTVRGRRLPISA